MKITLLGDAESIGYKASSILKFHGHVNTPETIIIQTGHALSFNHQLLDEKKTYIIRPSFQVEDGNQKSFAGYFTSLYPLKKDEVVKKLHDKKLYLQFGGNGYFLSSIIIQEFIVAKTYGVLFTRNPNDILYKGYYVAGSENNTVTSGKKSNQVKLSFFQEKELEFLGKKLEKIFGDFLDIEFCIKQKSIIILQARSITTGNNTIYNFQELQKISGIYRQTKYDEFGDHPSILTSSLIEKLHPSIYLGTYIYMKDTFFPICYTARQTTNETPFLEIVRKYRKYLISKYIFTLLHFLIPQKLDIKALEKLFENYSYSFNLFEKSVFPTIPLKKTNFITKKYLECEKKKLFCFKLFEDMKIQIFKNNNFGNNLKYLRIDEYLLSNREKQDSFIKKRKILSIKSYSPKLIIHNGIILNSSDKEDRCWIFKGKIEGKVVDLKSLKSKKGTPQILIIEDLNVQIYNKIPFLKGVIIKHGNPLSHNSIILREYKIPSIMQYKKYEDLKVGENISI